MAFTTYHADSDADDEYERSLVASPRLPDDSEASPIDSEPASAEPTPKTFPKAGNDYELPRSVITEWTAKESADFVAGLGLKQYSDAFIEHEMVGEALIAVKHDELKEMGISSVGHRLTILKSVYEIKVKQNVPIDPDHYVPLSAERDAQEEPVTQEDIAHLLRSIRLRDERLMAAEAELRKLADDYRRLREELLPIFKMAKDRSQPLPYQPTMSYGGSTLTPEHGHDPNATSPSLGQQEKEKPEKSGSSLSRTFSKKLFASGSASKNSSPTHIQQSIPEGRTYHDNSSLDPSAAAMAASSHLTASMNGQPSPKGVPSPTSPGGFYSQQTLGSRAYSANTPNRYDHSDDGTRQDRPGGGSSSHPTTTRNTHDPNGPSVEIFKSFRVSMDDPCHKVLPAALKKYNIHEDWRGYALFIVYGDQERCLGLEERPLILFKQLEKEGKKPMFMLRKQAPPLEGQAPNIYPSSAGIGIPSTNVVSDGSGGGGGGGGGGSGSRSQAPQIAPIQLPGGVL
ncbi:hypothetical protein VTO42DRAFT_3131 [Malbranchea cinnamomea]